MRPIPKYIENASIIGTPVSFKWTGRLDHIGPIEGTALHDSVYAITKCGTIALGAALEEWVVYLFGNTINQERYLAQADAIRAWTISPLYLKRAEEEEIENPPIPSAMSVISEFLWDATNDKFLKFPSRDPDNEVHVAFLVRYVMPKEKRKSFDTWFKWAIGQLAALSPRPEQPIGEFEDYESKEAYHQAQRPYFGVSVPKEALDPDFNYKSEMREDLLDRFLQNLDWKANPFLRSPDEMKKLKFKGTPYRFK